MGYVINQAERRARVTRALEELRLNGKTSVPGFDEVYATLGEACDLEELMTEYVEYWMHADAEKRDERAAKKASKASKKGKPAAPEVIAAAVQTAAGEQMSIEAAAAFLMLSDVRIRRMVKEGKLRYGLRGFVYTDGVRAEAERRAN